MAPVFTLRGTRGSIPVAGRDVLRYGGHTTCFDLATDSGPRILIDCGTGLRTLNASLSDTEREFHALITHYHFDHLQGLAFFEPVLDSGMSFTFYGTPWGEMSVQSAIERSMEPPLFPISLAETGSRKSYREISGDFTIGDVEVASAPLNHPQGVLGYRLSVGGRTIVVATDHEAGDGDGDEFLRPLADGADVLIHDAQFTPEEYEQQYRGWGHSTWRHAVAMAAAADVRRLILTSHDPRRSDDEIDAIVAAARGEFGYVEGGYEGMRLVL